MNFVKTSDELLEHISSAVEQIQKKFVPGDDMIRDCKETIYLCKCVEDILHHGLKEGLISWATEPSVWPLLEKISCQDDIDAIKKMCLQTDKEKCQVWIKMAVNVNLLGSYLSTLHHDRSLLSHYYDFAFLRDPVLTSTVESLLNYGIANFNFDISVQQEQISTSDLLRKQEVSMDYDSYSKELQENRLEINSHSGSKSETNMDKAIRKKRRKRVNHVVISNLDNETTNDTSQTNGQNDSPSNQELQSDKSSLSISNSSCENITDYSTEKNENFCDETSSKTRDFVEPVHETNIQTPDASTLDEPTVIDGGNEIIEPIMDLGNDLLPGEAMYETVNIEDPNDKINLKKCGTSPGHEVEDFLLANGSTTEKLNIFQTSSTHDDEDLCNTSNTDFDNGDVLHKESDNHIPPFKDSTDIDDTQVESKISQNQEQTSMVEQLPPNHYVKKIENPEFISSSYSSSYSDVTDASFDDRELNFIPGIHTYRQPSSYKSSSLGDKENSLSFDDQGLPVFDTTHFTDSTNTSGVSSIDGGSGKYSDISNRWDMFDEYLNIEEEHFAGPDNFAGLTTSDELEIAIEHYKTLVKGNTTKSAERDELIKKLIKLRLRLEQEKEGPVIESQDVRKVVSHHFQKGDEHSGRKIFCDQCGKIIWSLWQPLLTCKDCGYHSHKKCIEHIKRPCPIRTLSTVSYIMEICSDVGLDAQQYRCVECRKPIAISRVGVSEARLCDYTGQYYCDQCHWNDQMCIPARVVQNWDFVPYKVCRQSKQLLELTKTKPLLNLKEANPTLFRYVEELREVSKLRKDILIMKKYFLTCRAALESKLLIQLQKRQHFVDSPDIYSLQDILDINDDVLLPEISKIHALFLAHIKADCQLCRARGFFCEVCKNSSDIIFAFDPHAVKCTGCSAVFHKMCFKPEQCPKCERKKRISEKKVTVEEPFQDS